MSNKRTLNATQTKQAFIESIHKGLIKILNDNGNGKYAKMFTIDGNSIICNLPSEYFTWAEIPEGTKIAMNFVTKRN